MRYCPFCRGQLVEIDDIGTEGCELCGTVYKLLPMRCKSDEPAE